MKEYEELLKKELELDSKELDLHDVLIEQLCPLTAEQFEDSCELENISLECGQSAKEYIEDNIGEEFVVIEGLEDYFFCLHTVEDFLDSQFRKELGRRNNQTPKENFYVYKKIS